MKTLVTLAAALLLFACTAPNPTPMPSPPPPPEPTGLETLLKDLDPDAQAPLSSFEPEWWTQATKALKVTPAQAAELINKEPAFKLGGADVNHFDNGVRFLTVISYLESNREAGTCDAVCESGIVHSYHVFALWSFANPDAVVDRALTVSGVEIGPRRQSLAAFFARLIHEAPQRFRAVAVDILRRYPDSPEAVSALRKIAIVEWRAGNYAIADRAYAEVVTKLGKDAQPADFFEGARKAYQAGNIIRGHDFVTRAEPLSEDKARELADMEAWATEVGRLEHDSDYEDRVRLDELYMKLMRNEDVRRLSTALMDEHPEDARPALYFGHAEFNNYDLVAADTIMRRAGPEHRTIDFYQFTIGIRGAVGMNAAVLTGSADSFLSRFIADYPGLRALNDEYMAVEPSRAEWIGMTLDFAQVALLMRADDPKEQANRLRTAVDKMREQAAVADAKWPEPAYYARVRLLCAMLDKDSKRSRAAIADVTTHHTGDAGLMRLARSVLIMRALYWNDPAGLDALMKTLQASNERADRQFVLEVTAVRTDIKNVAAWDALATAYQAIGAPDDEAAKKRYISNLGVMRYRSNRKDEAHDLWFTSGNAGTEFPAALVNLYATDEHDRDTLWQALEYRMGVEDHIDHVIKAWTIRFTAKDKAAEKKALQELVKSEPPSMFSTAMTPNVALEKTLKIEVGFGVRLETGLSFLAEPWLIVEP